MEDTLGATNSYVGIELEGVLILVLMEDTLGVHKIMHGQYEYLS